MKILLTLNKTLSNGKSKWLDSGYYNVYLPLKDLDHEVYLWDTVEPDNPNYSKVVEDFKPDLIFCCITGDQSLTPAEHLCMESISKETEKGNCKTFNWFCDDVWRFDNFSSKMCKLFHVCSTTEPSYISKYKEIGYKNIILGGWHVNKDFHLATNNNKIHDMVFIGHLNNPERVWLIDYLRTSKVDIKTFRGVDHGDMVSKMSQSKIGINFSKNYCGFPVKTQVKLRPFEIAAANSLIFTQYHKDLEYFFEPEKEMICFKDEIEMLDKAKFLLSNQNQIKRITNSGNVRFNNEHESHIRMKKILQEAMDK